MSGWRTDAGCRPEDDGVGVWLTDLFYSELRIDELRAKRICEECLVRPECLEWALATNEKFGVWGGLTARERGRVRRRFKIYTAPAAVAEATAETLRGAS